MTPRALNRSNTVVTKTGYTRYRKAIEDGKISEIIKQPGNIQDKYDIWTKEIERQITAVKTKVKRINPRKDVRYLKQIKKELRRKLMELNEEDKNIAKERINMINIHIYNINKQARAEKIGKVTQGLKQKKTDKEYQKYGK